MRTSEGGVLLAAFSAPAIGLCNTSWQRILYHTYLFTWTQTCVCLHTRTHYPKSRSFMVALFAAHFHAPHCQTCPAFRLVLETIYHHINPSASRTSTLELRRLSTAYVGRFWSCQVRGKLANIIIFLRVCLFLWQHKRRVYIADNV